MERLFWDKVKGGEEGITGYNLFGNNIIFLRGQNIYKYNLESQVEEELAFLAKTFNTVTFKTEPNFKRFLIESNSELYLLEGSELKFLATKVFAFGFDLTYKQILYETETETVILNLVTKALTTFEQQPTNRNFKEHYTKAEIIFSAGIITFIIYEAKLYRFAAAIKILTNTEFLLIYETERKAILEHYRDNKLTVSSNTYLNNNKKVSNLHISYLITIIYQNITFYQNNFYLFERKLFNLSNDGFNHIPCKPLIMIDRYTHLAGNYLIVDSTMTIYQFNTYFNNPFTSKILLAVSPLLQTYSNNFSSIKNIKKIKTYEKKVIELNYKYTNFLGEKLLCSKRESLIEINLYDNTRKVLFEDKEINGNYIINEKYLVIFNNDQFRLFDWVTQTELWNFLAPELNQIRFEFDSSGTFVCFNFDSKSYYVLNLLTLAYNKISELSRTIPVDLNSVIPTTMSSLIESSCGFHCLIFCFAEETIAIDIETEITVGTISLKIRRNFSESIIHLRQNDLSFFAYYRNNILIAKTDILTNIHPLALNEFAFTGTKFLFLKTIEVYSVKTNIITKVFMGESSFDEISFRGTFIFDGDDIFKLVVFRRNPFSFKEISYLMTNFHDISIVAADTTFTFNKTILYAYSETFRDMLSSSLSEPSRSLVAIQEFPVACTQAEFLGAFTTLPNTNSYSLTKKYLGFP